MEALGCPRGHVSKPAPLANLQSYLDLTLPQNFLRLLLPLQTHALRKLDSSSSAGISLSMPSPLNTDSHCGFKKSTLLLRMDVYAGCKLIGNSMIARNTDGEIEMGTLILRAILAM